MELKSTSNLSAGRECETLTARYLEEKFNFKLISKNQKLSGIEIDLVMQDQKGLHLIEVKSVTNYDYLERRVTSGQRRRIRFVLNALLNQNNFARAHLAVVHNGRVDLYFDFFVDN